ncbi:MAG: hypothetical protein KatS3mg009_0673 [Acidimicrobiia bacterium]|nr:MAG: hypothetical protein KatS3mg009_0673 [Acidimicrobiia bacterium]
MLSVTAPPQVFPAVAGSRTMPSRSGWERAGMTAPTTRFDDLVPRWRAARPARHVAAVLLAAVAVGALVVPPADRPGAVTAAVLFGLAAVAGLASAARRARSGAYVVAGLALAGVHALVAPDGPETGHATVAIAVASRLVLAVGTARWVVEDASGARTNALDTFITALAVTAVSWPAFVQPTLAHTAVGAERAGAAGLLLAEVVLLVVAVHALLTGGRDRRALTLLSSGTALYALAGIASTQQWVFGERFELTALVIVCLACVVVRPQRDPGAPPGDEDRAATRLRMLAVVIVTLVCPAVLFGFSRMEGGLDGTALYAGIVGMVTFALLTARFWSLVGTEREVAVQHGMHRLAALVQNSHDAICVVDTVGVVSYASPAIQALTGLPADQVRGTALVDHFGRDAARTVALELGRARRTGRGGIVEFECPITGRDGVERHLEATVVNLLDDRSVAGLVVTLRDATARKVLETELEHKALRDDLTGLPNRALFMDRLQHALTRLGRSRSRIAAMFVDLDDFKAVNDGLGHAAGDALLVAVAQRLQGCLRPSDTVARMGGDEFAVLLEDVGDDASAIETANRLLDALREPVTIDGMDVDVPATIGLTVVDVPTPPGSVMRDADIALYRAKEAGKGRVVQFDPTMRWAAYERLRMRTQLAGALDGGHLRLVFQPIVALDSGRVAGGEALLRWDDPDLGPIPPSEFIAIAEESGLILTIGQWVIERACRYAMSWGDNGDDGIYVSVNVSARQLREPEFARQVADALRRTGLNPRRLMLELTETVLVDEIAARHLSEQIVPLGVRIAIDDFGTGYSSLAYLQRFPVDVVKIDKSFVAQIDRDGMRAVIESIAAIAVVMGYSSIAEGVETPAQLEQLLGFNCGYGQGYHYSEPLTPEAFLEHTAARVLVP